MNADVGKSQNDHHVILDRAYCSLLSPLKAEGTLLYAYLDNLWCMVYRSRSRRCKADIIWA
eukprot:3109351-Pleurochrysis_carterae.AAC.3